MQIPPPDSESRYRAKHEQKYLGLAATSRFAIQEIEQRYLDYDGVCA